MPPRAKTIVKTKRKKDTIMIDVFAGIDRSTSRYRIEGDGERFYEMSNVFPYIQGLLQRRRDAVQTNSRDSDNAFPTFPAQSLTGNPIVKHIAEFNNHIIILYEDDGNPGKALADRFDVTANTLTAVLTLTSLSGGPYLFTAGGSIIAVPYTPAAVEGLFIGVDGNAGITFDTSWAINVFHGAVTSLLAVSEVFLQAIFTLEKANHNRLGRSDPAGTAYTTNYSLAEDVGLIMRLMSFGYQTSSAGATTVLLIFKPTSIWVLTGIGATESIEQITGNIGLAGKDAVTYTPFGVCFVGRDTDGLLNLYLLDRNSLVLHTIGHELYEELNNIPKANYDDIVLSFHRNRMVRITMTKTGDSVTNNREYWMDFYNGLKKRTLWGPNFLPASNSLLHTISFSGGNTPESSGFFMLLKESDTYKIYEEINADTYNSTDSEWDNQIWRSKMYDFGGKYAIIPRIIIVALANGAKFKVYYETPKTGGDDDDMTQTLIGSYQMGTGGSYVSKPIRIAPGILRQQIGFKIESDYDGDDNNPFEMSQFGFEYEVTDREVIE